MTQIKECQMCHILNPDAMLVQHGDKFIYTCAKAYNEWLYDLYNPEGVPQEYLQSEVNSPCVDNPFGN
jgi:hypothetical protein